MLSIKHSLRSFLSVYLLCVAGFTQAQVSTEVQVAKQFEAFAGRNVTEKLFVHTDKEFYLAGEIVWYKIYYLDGKLHQPLDLSKLAYVEIIDQNNKPVMQGKNKLDSNAGSGSFFLPSSIGSGSYKFRAYTNWMKNTDAGFYFEKNITIINTLRPLNLPLVAPVRSFDIQFFPEGGNLVNGIESRVAFKLTDQYGKSTNFTGVVTDNNGTEVARFESFRFGMGSFVMKPVEGHSYTAVITTENGSSVSRSLPIPRTSGYVLRAHTDGDNLILDVVTNITEKANGAEVSILAHTRQEIAFAKKQKIVNGSARFSFPKKTLRDGVSHITIFNDDQQPVCERLFFKAPAKALSIAATPASRSYNTRNKVSVDLNTSFDGRGVPVELSLAVYQVDSLSVASTQHMQAYLLLNSDIRGYIENPSFYFSGNSDVAKAADNLMMTQGWRRFNWSQPLSKTTEAPEFAPEFDGHIVSATVTYNRNQEAVSGVKTYLTVPGTKTQFYAGVTDVNGRSFYDIRDYYGKNEVVVQTEQLIDSNYRIEISDPFSDRYSNKPFEAFDINTSHSNLIRHHSIAVQAHNAFLSDSLSRFVVPAIDSLPFYGRYTKRYLLDDFVRFTTMEEVLREYVPEIGVRRNAGTQRLLIADWNLIKYLEGEPLILLDGVPVSHKQILAYDPLKVRKLEIVTNRYITGKFVFDGIASFNTYEGNMPGFVFDSKAVILDYEGLQIQREYYSPVYENEVQRLSRVPDFRTLLAWQPQIKTDETGKAAVNFFTSDNTGSFIGVLHGIDKNGQAATQVFNFEVKK
ncbi:MAG: hypothetical protein EOO04_01745 [Chitinophagaceae bacterium]|nr:MAG: hypothetical protein EOO04_01745 [Chitinophagaceae bacterium]